jgi:hypothetical protein
MKRSLKCGWPKGISSAIVSCLFLGKENSGNVCQSFFVDKHKNSSTVYENFEVTKPRLGKREVCQLDFTVYDRMSPNSHPGKKLFRPDL